MSPVEASEPNAAQRDYWNSDVAAKWTDNAAALDTAFAAITTRIVAHAALAPGEHALDIGCGSGATTLAAARALGPGGEVLGLDISAPLLDLARRRAAAVGAGNARFLLADAQTEPLAEARYDAAVSRFGVMFFADPVAAFENIRKALAPGGRIAFAAWARLEDNPWFDVPRKRAIARLGPVAPAPPREPGPMAFAEAGWFAEVLGRAGFADVDIREETVPLAHHGTDVEAGRLLANIGPAVRVVREHGGTAEDVAAIAAATAADLAAYRGPAGLSIPARLNVALARRP